MADLRCAEKSKAVGHTRTGGFALNAWLDLRRLLAADRGQHREAAGAIEILN